MAPRRINLKAQVSSGLISKVEVGLLLQEVSTFSNSVVRYKNDSFGSSRNLSFGKKRKPKHIKHVSLPCHAASLRPPSEHQHHTAIKILILTLSVGIATVSSSLWRRRRICAAITMACLLCRHYFLCSDGLCQQQPL